MKIGLMTISCLSILGCMSFPSLSQEITNQSDVSQGVCKSGQQYWRQAKRLKNGALCSKFSFTQFFDIAINWNPKWNSEASKRYCPHSEQNNCFIVH
jgi:hypothetical protein